MRLITDEQYAQIVEALSELLRCPYDIDAATVSKAGLEATMQVAPYQVVGNMSVALFRVRKLREALSILQALPKVEVVGYEVWEAMCEPQLSRTKGGIKSLMKKLYATKDKT